MSMATGQLEISAFWRLQPVKCWCYVFVPGFVFLHHFYPKVTEKCIVDVNPF